MNTPVSDQDSRLLERAGAWPHGEVTSDAIQEVIRQHGMEFATALIYEALMRRSANRAFLNHISQSSPTWNKSILLGIVPGAFHRQHRHTGADGARVRTIAEKLGLRSEVVPTRSFGRIEENAACVAGWLRARHASAGNVVLVSLSKGGAEIKRALARPDALELFGKTIAWINLSGVVQGTPLVGWLRSRRLRWWGVRLLLRLWGEPWRTLQDLDHGPATPLQTWPSIPSHLETIHVVGFPLKRHLSHPWAPRAYERMSRVGPNDGGANLLADTLDYPGVTCPVWGVDHYLSPSWDIEAWLQRIVAGSLTWRQAMTSASQPKTAPATKSST